MKNFMNEFKLFIHKGNVVDLAVAVILGSAFNKIVSSLVNDLLMPLISLLIGGMDFKSLSITLKEASEGIDPLLLNYGLFIQNIIDFIIIAFSIFTIIKLFAKFERKKEVEEEKAPTENELSVLKDIKAILERH